MYHTHIDANTKKLNTDWHELRRYKGLVWMFTKRSFVLSYTQTVLGPLWLVITPIFTSIVHLVVFGGIAGLSTGGVPKLLFYLTGNAFWSFFSSCVAKTADVFTTNAHLFGKVYFPRLIMPVSYALGNLIRLGIQLIPAVVLLTFYVLTGVIVPSAWIAALPFTVLELGIMGTGIGLLSSSFTTKYRDLNIILGFGMSLWMYISPVVYPASAVSGWYSSVLLLNPVSQPLELMRLALFGTGAVSPLPLAWSAVFAGGVLTAGVFSFDRVERTFIDTV